MVSELPLVEARNLTKIYPARGSTKEFHAVDGIDFELQRGEAFGLLGPNGAGKSTTMRMIAATSPISGGSLRVLGMDPTKQGPEIRARLGVVTQDDCLDNELTVRENLHIYGRYFSLPRAVIRERANRLLDFAQLQEKAGDQVETLSGGMRRRLTIARSLINEPEILLLDEPTTGLDPQARHILWDRLFRLKQEGVTLILTTHYMDEAEQLCDRLIVVDHGRIVAQGSPRELINRYATREVLELRFHLDERDTAAEKLQTSTLATGGTDTDGRVELLPDRVLVYATDGEAALSAVHAMSLTPLTALVRRATLEDVFLKLTGRSLIE
ncbi:ABC transporter ATP-binding protein [Micromonospora luteifusca]|uniref:ABC transporter ATP-binding protein n=1 Tax=Micromonospora luteifusca TaxID=709860 RepID=UPI0019593FBC|nr:ABC transporter ATP-binding protein [Micromonospora luteifusca]